MSQQRNEWFADRALNIRLLAIREFEMIWPPNAR